MNRRASRFTGMRGDLPRSTVMREEDIVALKNRIAKAESERDTWRGAGVNEKYLAAYFLVETLELQLDELLRQPDR